MRNFFIILFVLLSTNLTAQSFTDIDKDDDGLIEVSNLETLNAMRYHLDGSGLKLSATAETITTGCAVGGCKGYELIKDLDFNDDASYSSTNNKVIWTTGEGWDPIGNYESHRNANNKPFKAIFEGNDHIISNLMIDRSANGVGLFGYTEGVTINKVGLLSVKIKGDRYVGSLVGSSSGNITNSYATGAVEGNSDIGGLVGYTDYGTVTNSYAMGNVLGNSHVGGLVGINNNSNITNSYATGSVLGNGAAVGGLVGKSWNSIIMNSYATGDVVGGNNGVGGLVSHNNGIIMNSYATGVVTGTGNSVGGLVAVNGNNSRVTNSYATGAVKGINRVGGLVGLHGTNLLIENSYATGAVTGTGNYVGSLVGWNKSGAISNSYWNTETSEQPSSADGIGKTTTELQSAIGQQENSNNPYYNWNTTDWDFGTSNQYPTLKYAKGPDENSPACGSAGQPDCGTLLPGQ